MKKNNKGFFLAETIVVIALVTAVMAFVYPNVTKLYDNYVNRTKYYDQTEDLYALKAVAKYIELTDGKDILIKLTDNGCKEFKNETNKMKKFLSNDNILGNSDFLDDLCVLDDSTSSCSRLTDTIKTLKEVYITGYMVTPDSNNYNFNKYLRRMKKTTYDSASYRLIGVFEEENITRYASIKIDNPNPNRNCNLGGE